MSLSAPDTRGTIVDEDTFVFLIDLEIHKATRLQYSVSVLAIHPDPESRGEMPDPRHLAEQVARVISREIRGTDLICLPASSSSLHVLLVGAELEHLPEVIRRITDQVSWHPFQIDGERKAVTLRWGGANFPTTAATREALLTQADVLLREARQGRPARSRYQLPGGPNFPPVDIPSHFDPTFYVSRHRQEPAAICATESLRSRREV